MNSLDDFLDGINWELARAHGISEDVIIEMRRAYIELWALLVRPNMYAKTGEHAVRQVKTLESILQFLWGFDLDPGYHRYHFLIKGCKCPQMVNQDLFGVDQEIYDGHCPFHGDHKHMLFGEGGVR
jgi:hypothetical protein